MTAEPEEIRPEELGEGTAVAVGSGSGDEARLTEVPASLPVLPLRPLDRIDIVEVLKSRD